MSDNGAGSGLAKPGHVNGQSGATDGSGAVASLALLLSEPASLAGGGSIRSLAMPTGAVAAVIQRGGFELASFADASGGVWSRIDDGRKPSAGLCKRCLEAASAAGSSIVVRE